jgi:hypothetical protein
MQAASFNFLYTVFFSVSNYLHFIPKYTVILFKRMLSQSGSFQVTYFHVFPTFPESHWSEYACFPSLALATITGNTMDAIHSLLWRTYGPTSHKGVSQGVHFEKSFDIISVRYTP